MRVAARLPLALLVLAVGCASVRSGRRDAGAWPLAGTPDTKPSISVLVGYRILISGKPTDPTAPSSVALWRAETEKTYRESGLFGSVVLGPADTDLRSEVDLTVENEPNLPTSILCGLTLFVFPGFGTATYSLHTRILNRAGEVVADRVTSAQMSTCISWLVLPATPFLWPIGVMRATVDDAIRMGLREAHAAGRI